MKVVATAGHVDHGKSTLIRALTGMEPDRWAEERRRGMTIDLGFAWTSLPGSGGERGDGGSRSGDDTVAFVDVPGHERFVTQMLAGVGPVPVTMFVVAADAGWMPQSGEHLDALDALGVEHGLLVVTRSDLADPELARDEALEHLAESSLGRLPAVCVSGATGEGIDELRRTLAEVLAGLPRPDDDADLRFWVDRAFSITGAGTVVTGTLGGGRIAVNDDLVLAGDGAERSVTVRGLQSLGEPVTDARAVARVAVNLRGVPLEDVARGHALLHRRRWLATDTVDVRLHPPRGAGRAGEAERRLPAEVMLHVGSAAVAARVRPLSRESGEGGAGGKDAVEPAPSSGAPSSGTPSSGAASAGTRTLRLTLHSPLPLRPGDRALLRDPGVRAVLGGVTVLDVRPPALRRRGAARARAGELARSGGAPDPAVDLARRRFVRTEDVPGLGWETTPEDVPTMAGWLVDPGHLDTLAQRLVTAVTEQAAADPLEPGLSARAAARALELPDPRLLPLVVSRPPASTELGEEGGRVLRRGGGELPAAVRTALHALRDDLETAPFHAPEADRLAELGLGTRQLGAAVRAGELVKVADGIYLRPDAPDRAVAVLATLEQPFTVSQARQALGTTRRVAVPLLELLAKAGRTRHDGDGHHEVKSRDGR